MNIQQLDAKIKQSTKTNDKKPSELVLTKEEHAAINDFKLGESAGRITYPANNNVHISGTVFTSMAFDGVRLHVEN